MRFDTLGQKGMAPQEAFRNWSELNVDRTSVASTPTPGPG